MAERKKEVAIVVPFHKSTFSDLEHVALQQCKMVLGDFPIIAAKPHNVEFADDVSTYFTNTISFDNHYFESIHGYNALLMSKVFYKEFLDYEFILIYQVDVFVFRNDLLDWCRRGYDYVGAPWINNHGYPDFIKATKSIVKRYLHTRFNILKEGAPSRYQTENKVGNGGFSLRRVSKFYDLCLKMRTEIEYYNSRKQYHYGEDVFWSVEVNRKRQQLNIPPYKVAVAFSIEHYPEHAMRLNKGKLPFGCHAWDRNLPFWRPILKEYGYSV